MLVKEITINEGKTAKERTISKVKLMFEPDILLNQALTLKKNFVPIYGMVHRISSKCDLYLIINSLLVKSQLLPLKSYIIFNFLNIISNLI
jgi:hypothetical protein